MGKKSPPFNPEDFFDNKCNCPNPEIIGDSTVCRVCGGCDPQVSTKKTRRNSKK